MGGRGEGTGRSEAHESAAQATVVEPAVASYQSASGVRYDTPVLLGIEHRAVLIDAHKGVHGLCVALAAVRACVCLCVCALVWCCGGSMPECLIVRTWYVKGDV